MIPGSQWIGGWVSPGPDLDAVKKRKISKLFRESIPDSTVSHAVVHWTDHILKYTGFNIELDNNL
jgi:hypothetical protein